MIGLTVLAVGKLKEPWLREGCGEYLKRLRLWSRPQVVEVDEYRLPETPSAAQIAACLEKEGERLKADLLSRVDTIESLTDSIAERAPLVAKEYREKLTERIGEYLTGKVDETRILTEAAVFADKCNIDEELTRLGAHIKAFRDICKLDEVGRKLDFLIQEFNRECNTICSKSNDKEVTALALSMKNEIEKVREQIQNLE